MFPPSAHPVVSNGELVVVPLVKVRSDIDVAVLIDVHVEAWLVGASHQPGRIRDNRVANVCPGIDVGPVAHPVVVVPAPAIPMREAPAIVVMIPLRHVGVDVDVAVLVNVQVECRPVVSADQP